MKISDYFCKLTIARKYPHSSKFTDMSLVMKISVSYQQTTLYLIDYSPIETYGTINGYVENRKARNNLSLIKHPEPFIPALKYKRLV